MRLPGKISRLLASVSLAALLGACEGRLILTSDPSGLEVYAGDKKLGSTPLGISFTSLERAKISSGYLLRLEKSGLSRVSVFFPRLHRDMEVNLNLHNVLEIDRPEAVAKVDEGSWTPPLLQKYYADSASLLEQQTRAASGKAVNQSLLKRLQQDYPTSGAPHMIEALDRYRSGAQSEAVTALQNAIRANPWDEDYTIILSEMSGKDSAKSVTDKAKH